MPIYEYQCQKCGEHFEELRTHDTADTPIVCVKCHSRSPKRILSTFNAKSSGGTISSGSTGCSGCAGGNCASCH